MAFLRDSRGLQGIPKDSGKSRGFQRILKDSREVHGFTGILGGSGGFQAFPKDLERLKKNFRVSKGF